MPETPRYPTDSTSDDDTPGYDVGSKPRVARSTYLWGAVAIVVVVGFMVLHLTGVLGPGAH